MVCEVVLGRFRRKFNGQAPMSQTHIIIVNYNAGQWLSRSLKSALEHSDGPISVVDNASQDDSVESAHKMLDGRAESRVDWTLNKENLGFAAANNQVLARVESEYAVLLNPDCEMNAETLPNMLKAFGDDEEIGLASCKILNLDGSVQETSRRAFPTPWSALVRMLYLEKLFPNIAAFKSFNQGASSEWNNDTQRVEAISGAFMVVRVAAMKQVGMLDEDYFMHCEDLDWCKRFILAGWAVASVGDASVLHAKGVSSRSRPIGVLWTLHKGMNRFFDKFYTQQSSIVVRVLVKIGIVVSFLARSAVAALKGLFGRH